MGWHNQEVLFKKAYFQCLQCSNNLFIKHISNYNLITFSLRTFNGYLALEIPFILANLHLAFIMHICIRFLRLSVSTQFIHICCGCYCCFVHYEYY